MFVADHKLDRIYVTPGHFSEIGESSIRTLRLQVQAPPNPGLYTFQMYVKSDCYLGTDIRKDMKVRSLASSLEWLLIRRCCFTDGCERPRCAHCCGEPRRRCKLVLWSYPLSLTRLQEISEPDEDTLAGQMALMQGKGVKRIAHASDDEDDDESDDTSGTEESASEAGTTSESDSD